MRRHALRGVASALLLGSSVAAAPASADPAPPPGDPDDPSGIVEPERHADDLARDIGSGLLFVPRQVLDVVFWGSTVAVGVLERQQIAPRAQSLLTTGGGRVAVLPTVFAETGQTFDVGLRMVADLDRVATGLRVGFGGVDSVELEPRVAVVLPGTIPGVLTFEALYARDDDRDYLGVGQDPADDPRNRFRFARAGDEVRYLEERTRFIAGYSGRLAEDFELVLSGSLLRREVADLDDTDEPTLAATFEPGSVPGAFESRWYAYVESAIRLDTRPTRGRPSSGVLLESYAGTSRGLVGNDAALVRVGGRAAAFLPVYRRTNILSPRLVLDGVASVGGRPVPFTELAGQPDFRGLDTRRDLVSAVASVDYRWLFVDHLAARVFVDVATVAPSLDAIAFDSLRPALGFAFDVHTDTAEIGQLGLSMSPEGPELLLSFGLSTGYGDRQHRD